jgi:hypothetical protein
LSLKTIEKAVVKLYSHSISRAAFGLAAFLSDLSAPGNLSCACASKVWLNCLRKLAASGRRQMTP